MRRRQSEAFAGRQAGEGVGVPAGGKCNIHPRPARAHCVWNFSAGQTQLEGLKQLRQYVPAFGMALVQHELWGMCRVWVWSAALGTWVRLNMRRHGPVHGRFGSLQPFLWSAASLAPQKT